MQKLEHTYNNVCPKCVNNDDSPDYDTILCKMMVPYATNNDYTFNKPKNTHDVDKCRICNVCDAKYSYSFPKLKNNRSSKNKIVCQNCYDNLQPYKTQQAKL